MRRQSAAAHVGGSVQGCRASHSPKGSASLQQKFEVCEIHRVPESPIEDSPCPHTVEVCGDNQAKQGRPHAKSMLGCYCPLTYDCNIPAVAGAAERRAWGIKVFQEALQFVMFESPRCRDATEQTAFVTPSAAAQATTMLVSLPLPADSTCLCFFRPRGVSLLLFYGCVLHTPRQRLLGSWHFVCVVTWADASELTSVLASFTQ